MCVLNGNILMPPILVLGLVVYRPYVGIYRSEAAAKM
jgi:hypothetical protein